MSKETEKTVEVKDKETFSKGLSERITEAEDILNYEYYDSYHLNLLIVSYERWDNGNIKLLYDSFSNVDNEYIAEYNFLKLNEYIFSLSDEKQISIYIDYIKRKIELLKEVLSAL